MMLLFIYFYYLVITIYLSVYVMGDYFLFVYSDKFCIRSQGEGVSSTVSISFLRLFIIFCVYLNRLIVMNKYYRYNQLSTKIILHSNKKIIK